VYDFHTHTFLSDGVLSPIELIRRAMHIGYKVIAITDHVGPGNMEFVLNTLTKDCAQAENRWDIKALPGVELTHTPKEDIDRLAKEAKLVGAKIVNVHGETIVEPVEPGTNNAAVSSTNVDILAHPGLITLEEAQIAAKNGVFLEISGRKSHGLANGHVFSTAKEAGANLILDSDAHEPSDLMTRDYAEKIGMGAGLSKQAVVHLLEKSPVTLLKKIMSQQAIER